MTRLLQSYCKKMFLNFDQKDIYFFLLTEIQPTKLQAKLSFATLESSGKPYITKYKGLEWKLEQI